MPRFPKHLFTTNFKILNGIHCRRLVLQRHLMSFLFLTFIAVILRVSYKELVDTSKRCISNWKCVEFVYIMRFKLKSKLMLSFYYLIIYKGEIHHTVFKLVF